MASALQGRIGRYGEVGLLVRGKSLSSEAHPDEMFSVRSRRNWAGSKGHDVGGGAREQKVRGLQVKLNGRGGRGPGGCLQNQWSLINRATLEKSLKFSEPQFPHLFSGDNKRYTSSHPQSLPCAKAPNSVLYLILTATP